MALERYAGATELKMNKAIEHFFKSGFQTIQAVFKKHGLAPEGLIFSASQHTLTITPEETDAFHVYADGKPFYIVSVQTAENLMTMTVPHTLTTSTPPKQQAAYLALDIGMTLMPEMDKILKEGHGGTSGDFSGKFGCNMRYEPYVYCQALATVIDWRLTEIMPKQTPAKKQGGPAI